MGLVDRAISEFVAGNRKDGVIVLTAAKRPGALNGLRSAMINLEQYGNPHHRPHPIPCVDSALLQAPDGRGVLVVHFEDFGKYRTGEATNGRPSVP